MPNKGPLAHLTVRQLDAELTVICRENPDTVNPTGENGACAYTGPDGSHCLIGQFLANRGLELPETGTAHYVFHDLGAQPEVQERAQDWQVEADGDEDIAYPPRPWGELPLRLGIDTEVA